MLRRAASVVSPYGEDLDKLEMIMQAGEYERAQGKELGQFFDSTAGKFTTPVGQAWEAEIVRRRRGGGEN